MIREAEEEGRRDAAASFRVALDRERHHRDMFRAALAVFDRTRRRHGPHAAAAADAGRPPVASATPGARRAGSPALPADASTIRAGFGASSRGASDALSSIREVVFGAQDGLVSTFAVVAGLAAAGVGHLVVCSAAPCRRWPACCRCRSALFWRRARSASSTNRARTERREIRDHPGEEIAELIAALMARGMARPDAVEVARRMARHPDLLLTTLAIFELGLAPQRLGTPVRDAFVMAVAFGGGSLVPLLPFLLPHVLPALALSAALTLIALFGVGLLKGGSAGSRRPLGLKSSPSASGPGWSDSVSGISRRSRSASRSSDAPSLLVCLGGALGTVSATCRGACRQWLGAEFPYGTLTVSRASDLRPGRVDARRRERARPVVPDGRLWGVTTYSAFSYETVQLIQSGAGGGVAERRGHDGALPRAVPGEWRACDARREV